jgi:hypothetical protein
MDSDSEQMFHDLEQRHLLLRKEHDVVCIEKEAFKGKQMVMNKIRKITTVTQLPSSVNLPFDTFNDSPSNHTKADSNSVLMARTSIGKLATLQNEVVELRGKLASAQSETLSRDLDLKQVNLEVLCL